VASSAPHLHIAIPAAHSYVLQTNTNIQEIKMLLQLLLNLIPKQRLMTYLGILE
jgi:hypothetical protein